MLRWLVIGSLSVAVNALGWGLLGSYLGRPAEHRARPPVELSVVPPTPPPAPRPVPRVEPRPAPPPRLEPPRACAPRRRPRPVRRVVARPAPSKLSAPRPVALAALDPTPTGDRAPAPADQEGITAPKALPVVAPPPRRAAPPAPPRPQIDLAGLKGRIRAAIARHRHYPRQARRRGLEGTVLLAFRISPAGAIRGVRVVRSAGAMLDDAARAALRKAGPLPFYPDEVRIAVRYQLDD